METPRNPERAVLEKFNEGQLWTKGTFYEDDPEDNVEKACLIGCWAWVFGLEAESIDDDLLEPLRHVIVEQYPGYFAEDPESIYDNKEAVIRFNDHPLTEWVDVEKVLEKTAMRRDEVIAD